MLRLVGDFLFNLGDLLCGGELQLARLQSRAQIMQEHHVGAEFVERGADLFDCGRVLLDAELGQHLFQSLRSFLPEIRRKFHFLRAHGDPSAFVDALAEANVRGFHGSDDVSLVQLLLDRNFLFIQLLFLLPSLRCGGRGSFTLLVGLRDEFLEILGFLFALLLAGFDFAHLVLQHRLFLDLRLSSLEKLLQLLFPLPFVFCIEDVNFLLASGASLEFLKYSGDFVVPFLEILDRLGAELVAVPAVVHNNEARVKAMGQVEEVIGLSFVPLRVHPQVGVVLVEGITWNAELAIELHERVLLRLVADPLPMAELNVIVSGGVAERRPLPFADLFHAKTSFCLFVTGTCSEEGVEQAGSCRFA